MFENFHKRIHVGHVFQYLQVYNFNLWPQIMVKNNMNKKPILKFGQMNIIPIQDHAGMDWSTF